LANSPQARKRARQNDKRREHNNGLRSKMRTSVKNVRKAIAAGEKEQAQDAFKVAVPMLDKMTGKGVIARNTAARYKSRINAAIKGM